MKTTPANLINEINQAGITYGDAKLKLMQQACRIMQVPTDNIDEDGETIDPILRVRLFDPTSQWSWLIQDWDGSDICFGYVHGIENEWGSFSLRELSAIPGPLGIGIEIDTYYSPVHPDIATQ